MPDISMCKGEAYDKEGYLRICPIKDDCYRYTAFPNSMQSYFFRLPYMWERDGCPYFYDNKNQVRHSKNHGEEV